MASSGHKSIVRIDQPEKKTHGYQVRVVFKKKTYRKWFPDHLHGKRNGLKLSVKYRDWLERDLGKPRTDRAVYMLKPKKKCGSNTNVLGVHFSLHNTIKRGKLTKSPAFTAHWSPRDGKVKTRSFSILRYGKRKAFQMACDVRKQMERQIYGLA